MFEFYMDKIYERYGTEDIMHELVDVLSDFMDDIQYEAPKHYQSLMCKLEKYLYNITLDEAKEIVSNMCNEYGHKGEKWSYEQIVEVSNKYQVPERIKRCELYVVMNMWYTDYYDTMLKLGLIDSVEAYIHFSVDWLEDIDFGEGKVYKYFIKMQTDEEE